MRVRVAASSSDLNVPSPLQRQTSTPLIDLLTASPRPRFCKQASVTMPCSGLFTVCHRHTRTLGQELRGQGPHASSSSSLLSLSSCQTFFRLSVFRFTLGFVFRAVGFGNSGPKPELSSFGGEPNLETFGWTGTRGLLSLLYPLVLGCTSEALLKQQHSDRNTGFLKTQQI